MFFGDFTVIDLITRVALVVGSYVVARSVRAGERDEPRTLGYGAVALAAAVWMTVADRSLHGVLLSVTVGVGYWFIRSGRRALTGRPLSLLFAGCSFAVVAEAGALAALSIATYLYEFGLLGDHVFWSRGALIKAVEIVAAAALGGAAFALAQRRLRKWWPEPYTHPVGGRRIGLLNVSDTALWPDDLILTLVALAPLWKGLDWVWPTWDVFFIWTGYGIVFPAFVFYRVWSMIFWGWLRWVGDVRQVKAMQFLAYGAILEHENLQPWFDHIQVTFEPERRQYRLSGAVPSSALASELNRCLSRVGQVDVDASALRIDRTLKSKAEYHLPGRELLQRVEKRVS